MHVSKQHAISKMLLFNPFEVLGLEYSLWYKFNLPCSCLIIQIALSDISLQMTD